MVAMPPRPMIYKPAGIPLEGLRRVVLLPEELEALRLTDLEDLTQEDAAERMGVSRSTFQRTISQAHRQVALALTEGAALAIEGSHGRSSAAACAAINRRRGIPVGTGISALTECPSLRHI